jgi:pimeloyl-ACP methyl ester carboxylesterase
MAKTIGGLLEQLKIGKCSFYLHDYGGFRIILAHPERVRALIFQNANAYKEGLGAAEQNPPDLIALRDNMGHIECWYSQSSTASSTIAQS